MRVSTINFNNIMLRAMQDSMAKLAITNEQMAAGKRILQPSDDSVDTVKILQINNEITAIEQYEDNIDSARRMLEQQDVLYSSMTDQLRRARDIILQASNEVLSVEDYKPLAEELETISESLLSLANYQQSDEQYLFSGTLSTQMPVTFDATTGDYSYSGNNNLRQVNISGSAQVPVNESGENLFFDSAITPPATMDSIFDALSVAVAELRASDPKTVFNSTEAMKWVDATLERVGIAQTKAGSNQTVLDRVGDSHADIKLMLESLRSSLEDVDMAKAATDLAHQQTVLSASQQVYANIKQLSLFNYF
ncbi:flagellar hook-associated protein FlgL [Endozoicomonas sp. 4G]|uniref:flagellar hook-associated protein FlgL n=1 Tax=Endozoicomonas sp. 4G TaxID=2872754 RepID=UPI0020787E0A|nr:flagellar hook-associated protein FlgL [Endozoicomonas sp. 4G]